MAIVIVSGYFNPVHKGHIEYIQKATNLGRFLIAIVNNDFQVKLKGSRKFMDEEERVTILKSIKGVDEVILSVDKDRSVSQTIKKIYHRYKHTKENFIFAKGGDQLKGKLLEDDVCEKLGIKIVDGLGEKIQSSSWLKEKI